MLSTFNRNYASSSLVWSTIPAVGLYCRLPVTALRRVGVYLVTYNSLVFHFHEKMILWGMIVASG